MPTADSVQHGPFPVGHGLWQGRVGQCGSATVTEPVPATLSTCRRVVTAARRPELAVRSQARPSGVLRARDRTSTPFFYGGHSAAPRRSSNATTVSESGETVAVFTLQGHSVGSYGSTAQQVLHT